MNNKRRSDVLELINFISKTKNYNKELIISFLLNSIKRIINSQLDPEAEITLEVINNELILTNLKKLVIPDDEEYKGDSKVIDIHLSEAQKINPDIKEGDTIASQINFDDFSRSLYSKIEQSFRLEILHWEKKRVYDKYQPLIGKTVEAKLEEDFGGKGATFTLEDGTLCYMPTKYQNKSINLSNSKYHKVTIEEVYESSKNYQVLVSNDSPSKVRELLKNEIPEIENGEIQIVGISRAKGERAKISFRQNPNYEGQLDVVGSIIGPNGSRINKVSEEFGEKIDVVLYSPNIIEYISNALSPAKIVSVNKKNTNNDFLVVVPNNHNTLAIGKKGLNVKLTVELIRVNIDICSYSYAIENNIPINWNGNLTEEELKVIDSQNYSEERKTFINSKANNRKSNKTWANDFLNIDEFDKEIEEYNAEISSYEPTDYSNFEFNPSDNLDIELNNQEINEIVTNKKQVPNNQKISKNEINKVNENFKFDSDIAADINIDDLDFSDFDDEEF